jgi:hypothetical protein
MTEPKQYTRRDATHPVRFTGIQLAFESTETDNALRWTELELFKVTEGKFAGWYFLHRVGQSVVYHKPKACGFGVQTSWDKVPTDAEPCPVCKPGPGQQVEVWLESPRPNIDRCETPEHVENVLLMKPRRDGSRFLSTPARNLLAKAAQSDAGIKALTEKIEDI